MKTSTLTILNFIVTGYFLLLYTFYYFNLSPFALQFVGELLTIPFFFAQWILVYISFRRWRSESIPLLTKLSSILLLLTALLSTGSLFF